MTYVWSSMRHSCTEEWAHLLALLLPEPLGRGQPRPAGGVNEVSLHQDQDQDQDQDQEQDQDQDQY